jgi:hypothetical protein
MTSGDTLVNVEHQCDHDWHHHATGILLRKNSEPRRNIQNLFMSRARYLLRNDNPLGVNREP